MRQRRLTESGEAYYHIMSRVVNDMQNVQGMNQRLCNLGITFRPLQIDVTYDFVKPYLRA